MTNHRSATSLVTAFNMLLELTKIKITMMVTLTTALGYILGIDVFGNISPDNVLNSTALISGLIFTVTGIFLLACAASVLNHYQERVYDSMMDRTKHRPIPSGRVKPGGVLAVFFILLLTGSAVLILNSTVLAFAVGLFTLFWYNFVYTPLKRKTAFAIIPGALVGALPPLAGWAGINQVLVDPRIILIIIYFFVWQIPHFWLLLILYGKDYEKAGYPTLNHLFNDTQLRRITFMWLIATVITGLMITISGVINFQISNILLIAISLWMIYNSVMFLFTGNELGRKQTISTFIKINLYTLLIISLLSADKLIKII